MPHHNLLHDIFHDLVQKLVDLSSEENMFVFQPCRDNTLYLLKLVDEMLISELDNKLPVCKVLKSVFYLSLPVKNKSFIFEGKKQE